MVSSWEFIDDAGSFNLADPHRSSYLYFPLANEGGMMSSVTPTLNGDVKAGQNMFFSVPVTSEDLHNSKSGRNFWVYIHGRGAWSAAGASSAQTAGNFSGESGEFVSMEAGFLWHRILRENRRLGIKSEITNFVPVNNSRVELMRVCITNTGTERITVTPTAAIPVYARSADNVRDHRHVTSLLGRIYTMEAGIEVQPVMTFDERGHRSNELSYNVYGVDESGNFPIGTFPCLQEFIGEGGCLEWPEWIVRNERKMYRPGNVIEGYEGIGALRFQDEDLEPGETKTYIITLSITEGRLGGGNAAKDNIGRENAANDNIGCENVAKDNTGSENAAKDNTGRENAAKDNTGSENAAREYPSREFPAVEYPGTVYFRQELHRNRRYWEEKLGAIGVESPDKKFNLWMKWVSLQPVLRRIYGCSFMPHHDYGKGGRGWRDLWQDCLALLLMEPETVRKQLLDNFGGVRMDGTNATIIGNKSGEFIADRNNIGRVWSDHGVWPFFTTLLYINQSGDMDFLFEQQTYFKDRLIMRCGAVDPEWTTEYGNKQKGENGEVYTGTVLEHILLQNLVAFFNVGQNNNIRLENADWNDAFDMACDKGESVAFTSFYAGNLMEAGKLLKEIKKKKGIKRVELAAEIGMLLDTFHVPVDYDSPEAKTAMLQSYFKTCRHNLSGAVESFDIDLVLEDLEKKACWLMEHIRKNEWIVNGSGYEWFNGYYDNSGKKVEGDHECGVRMTLTGQVFPVMMGIASQEQIQKVVASVEHFLFDEKLQGYRLNTDFKEVKLDLGRCFGFAYGHKENGAIFSHMVVMYAAALYRRGFVSEGYRVICSLYDLSTDFEKGRIYPGIPEYFDDRGRGVYHYLTGSASWLMLVLLNDVHGVRGRLGDLAIQPKLKKEQFGSAGRASVHTVFAGRKLNIVYKNEECLDYEEYFVADIFIDGCPAEFTVEGGVTVIDRNRIELLQFDVLHDVEVYLKRKKFT